MTNPVTQDKKKQTGAENIHWNLNELYKSIDDPRIQGDLRGGEKAAEAFVNQYKGNINKLSPEALKAAYKELEDLLSPLYRLSQYSHLIYAVDTSNTQAKKVQATVDEVLSQISNLILFFDLELSKVSEAKYHELFESKELSNYSYPFYKTWKTATYNLSEKEEQVINLKNFTGVKAFRQLYSDLTSSFQFDFTVDGETKKLNGSELRALRYHESPEVRRKAMKVFFDRYEENQLIISNIFNSIIKDHSIEKDLRGYPSSISIMNINNDLDEGSVEALHAVTTESYPLVQRYYKLKSRLLGMDDMTLADIYAPLPSSSKFYSWNEAKSIVLESFHAFDDEFYQMAHIMFTENRIDAPVLPTKRGGAFCSSSTPGLKPYVLLNYIGRQRDISTMAHELGHAIHDMFCSEQTLVNYHPILPLAETASVFSEMIVTDRLLKDETDNLVRQSLLTDKLEDIFATSHRQNMFSRFELASHKGISKQMMASEELCELYKNELKLMFGDSIQYTSEYDWEWSSIPHIFEVPFYVYAYNFANLLVIALYQQYLEEGKAFIPRLKGFLRTGGGVNPVEITKQLGVDIRNPDFWRKSIVYIEGLVNELENLVLKGLK